MSELRRTLTHRRLRHYGHPPDYIAEGERQAALMETGEGHRSLGCEIEMDSIWWCRQVDDDASSNHVEADVLGHTAEWVGWVLDELREMGVEVPGDV